MRKGTDGPQITEERIRTDAGRIAEDKAKTRVQGPKTGYLSVRGVSMAGYPPLKGGPLKKAAENTSIRRCREHNRRQGIRWCWMHHRQSNYCWRECHRHGTSWHPGHIIRWHTGSTGTTDRGPAGTDRGSTGMDRGSAGMDTGSAGMDRGGSADTNDEGPAGNTHGIQTESVRCSTVLPKFAAEGTEARTVYDEQ